jgi:magnesium transporter
MNFAGEPYNMPELGWRFGYLAVLLGMAGTSLVMVSYFREEGWL